MEFQSRRFVVRKVIILINNETISIIAKFNKNLMIVKNSTNVILISDVHNVYSLDFCDTLSNYSKQFIKTYLKNDNSIAEANFYQIINILLLYKMKYKNDIRFVTMEEFNAISAIGYVLTNCPNESCSTLNDRLYELRNNGFNPFHPSSFYLFEHFMEISTVLFSNDEIIAKCLYKDLIGTITNRLKDKYVIGFDPFDKLLDKTINKIDKETNSNKGETSLF